MITNKMKIVQLKMREARFWPKMKFEPIFFSGSLAVFQSERVASAGGRKGGLGGIPPALQILGEICSNFFVKRPPVGKCLCWLALREGSPADFNRKLEFFIPACRQAGLPRYCGVGQKRAFLIFNWTVFILFVIIFMKG